MNGGTCGRAPSRRRNGAGQAIMFDEVTVLQGGGSMTDGRASVGRTPARAVDPARSRIVLVGSPFYDDPSLTDVPQVARNLADLAEVFSDPALGGFPAEHCLTADPGTSVEQVGDLLVRAAAEAEDLLLFYFAGHGLIGPRNELYLCLRSTRWRNPAFSALRFETVRDAFLEHSHIKNRAVILDCCFSGRASGILSGPGADAVAEGLEITGPTSWPPPRPTAWPWCATARRTPLSPDG
ncbi:hypothetical protein KDL01_31035 [Actinospica durhamensis]|uniref:Caspase family protein n=1 Tax=Actinospica durhamensis TaxID=1508375 RepID=A0A941EWK6_9ACTN|nr:hypothetical protein [Actinospica durhamensis]MBR7837753.1 hypothetical protein [Actinospica durhamensis]